MQHLLSAQLLTLKQKLRWPLWHGSLLVCIPTLCNFEHYWWKRGPRHGSSLPVEGLPGTVSLSRHENENSWCHGSPSQRWEGRIGQRAEPDSPAAKDKSSYSWIRLLETPRPVLNRWLITFDVSLSLSQLISSTPPITTSRLPVQVLTCISQKEPLLPTNFWCILLRQADISRVIIFFFLNYHYSLQKCISKSHSKDRGLPCALHMKMN